jgi:purine-nucleoside phosphorylase
MAPTSDLTQRLDEAAAAVRQKSGLPPLVGVVLGSGLGAFAERLERAVAIPYGEIPHMPAPAVSGHAGKLWIGESGDVAVACLQGRVHLYEGWEPHQTVFGARLLARLGCEAVLLTNAAGGVRDSFKPGSLMLLIDHLNLTGQNPLVGPNAADLGPRFPDMSRPYDPRLSKLVRDAAADIGLHLEEGVYAGLLGPTYETPAEIRAFRTLGADAVGMSTVLEVIALRHMGVRVAAISCITNMAAGMSPTPLDHAEVEETAGDVRETFIDLLTRWIAAIGAVDWNEATGKVSRR